MHFFLKVIWPELFDGARPIYEALKKVELSQETYNELLGLYGQKLDGYITNSMTEEIQTQILQDVACEWLNKEDENYAKIRKNYERWTDVGVTKKVLQLASFFPLTGEKYTAVELLPGTYILYNMKKSSLKYL